MKKAIRVAVLTVNFNGEDKCNKLIKSLDKSTFKNYTVYIVDNGSNRENYDNLKNMMKGYGNNVKIIRSNKNLGWGLGCNLGLKEILKNNTDYTFVVNNDAELDNDCLFYCIETMEDNKKIGICGIKTLDFKGNVQTVGGKITLFSKLTGILRQNKERIKETKPIILGDNEFVDDCGWMIRTSKASDVIWYPKHLFMYAEELYINKGQREKGRVIAFDPRAIMYHANMGSSGGGGNPFTTFYVTRNRYLFMKDYYPFYFPAFLIIHTLFVFPLLLLKYSFKKRWNLVKSVCLGIWSAFVYLTTKKKLFFLKIDGKWRLKEIK